MSGRATFLWLLAINALIAVGDVFSKKAVASSTRDVTMTGAALALWFAACCAWLPVMRAKGFTRLVVLADAMGLVMLAAVGYLFLGERLTAREGAGVGCALVAVFLLRG